MAAHWQLVDYNKLPFRYWVIDNFVDTSVFNLLDVLTEVPEPTWSGWVRYDNDCERGKRTTEDFSSCPKLSSLFDYLREQTHEIRQLTSISDLQPTMRCGGLHVTDPGGWLNCHLDAAIYPDGRERRANLVLFMNTTWTEHGGGNFELYNASARVVSATVASQFNRAVLWEASDLAYHGVSKVLGRMARLTAALYYLASPRPGVVRQRALFVPHRQ